MAITTYKAGKRTWLRGARCPICHKDDWCLLSEDHKTALCMRVDHGKDNEKLYGGSLYYLDGNKIEVPSEISNWESQPIASSSHLHVVYSLVADLFGLTNQDQEHLEKKRGLTREQGALRKYFSTDFDTLKKQVSDKKTIWPQLFKEYGLKQDAWKGVPGFYYDKKNKCPVFMTKPGIAIPCRNQYGQITGLQVRVHQEEIAYFVKNISNKQYDVYVKNIDGDAVYSVRNIDNPDKVENGKATGFVQLKHLNLSFEIKSGPKYVWVSSREEYLGTSAQAGTHFAYPDELLLKAKFDQRGYSLVNLWELTDKKVVVTEGLLKSDIAISHLENEGLGNMADVVVAIPGVSFWKKAIDLLVYLEAGRMISAFDQDFKVNKAVKGYMEQLIDYSIDHDLETYLLTWEVGKGIDDVLLTNLPYEDKGWNIFVY